MPVSRKFIVNFTQCFQNVYYQYFKKFKSQYFLIKRLTSLKTCEGYNHSPKEKHISSFGSQDNEALTYILSKTICMLQVRNKSNVMSYKLEIKRHRDIFSLMYGLC